MSRYAFFVYGLSGFRAAEAALRSPDLSNFFRAAWIMFSNNGEGERGRKHFHVFFRTFSFVNVCSVLGFQLDTSQSSHPLWRLRNSWSDIESIREFRKAATRVYTMRSPYLYSVMDQREAERSKKQK